MSGKKVPGLVSMEAARLLLNGGRRGGAVEAAIRAEWAAEGRSPLCSQGDGALEHLHDRNPIYTRGDLRRDKPEARVTIGCCGDKREGWAGFPWCLWG